jgi:hypothetical protein
VVLLILGYVRHPSMVQKSTSAVAPGVIGGASPFHHRLVSVNKQKWLAQNKAMLTSLRVYPNARYLFSKSWGIPDHIVQSAADDGPPYGGYVTQYTFRLPKPVSVVAVVDFYARQLNGWIRKSFLACETRFISPKGALVDVDACSGEAHVTSYYVVDINYDEAGTIGTTPQDLQAH